jgi:hypothetical protein
MPCPAEESVHMADWEVDRLLADGWKPGQVALL